MTGWMKKVGLGAALAATTLSAAAPADAQRWGGYRHYNRGGNAAAGALLGGIVGLGIGAAIASNNGGGRYYDRGGYYGGYNGYNGYYAPPPPPPPVVYDRGYYNDYYPRCFDQWRYDPYYGQRVRVRVCD